LSNVCVNDPNCTWAITITYIPLVILIQDYCGRIHHQSRTVLQLLESLQALEKELAVLPGDSNVSVVPFSDPINYSQETEGKAYNAYCLSEI
jgi:hypothetical protein